MSYFSTKIIKCVISRVLLLNVEYSYYPFGIFLGGSGGPEVSPFASVSIPGMHFTTPVRTRTVKARQDSVDR